MGIMALWMQGKGLSEIQIDTSVIKPSNSDNREFFNQEQLATIRKICSQFIDYYGYEK